MRRRAQRKILFERSTRSINVHYKSISCAVVANAIRTPFHGNSNWIGPIQMNLNDNIIFDGGAHRPNRRMDMSRMTSVNWHLIEIIGLKWSTYGAGHSDHCPAVALPTVEKIWQIPPFSHCRPIISLWHSISSWCWRSGFVLRANDRVLRAPFERSGDGVDDFKWIFYWSLCDGIKESNVAGKKEDWQMVQAIGVIPTFFFFVFFFHHTLCLLSFNPSAWTNGFLICIKLRAIAKGFDLSRVFVLFVFFLFLLLFALLCFRSSLLFNSKSVHNWIRMHFKMTNIK